ncbi:MAG: hypothetical protein ACM33T_03590 [Solirubrobacterales bacterium]
MPFPEFFAAAPTITLVDPLMRFLGGSDDGVLEYRYEDAVRLAGHSCPTVAGAFLMVRTGLKALYGDDLPERGAVRVLFPDEAAEGVTGVMGAVASLITGARGDEGFKGIAGRFDRRFLLEFDADVGGAMALERVADGRRATITYAAHIVPHDPGMRPLLERCIAGIATADEEREFGRLWQDRVRRVLERCDDPEMLGVALS